MNELEDKELLNKVLEALKLSRGQLKEFSIPQLISLINERTETAMNYAVRNRRLNKQMYHLICNNPEMRKQLSADNRRRNKEKPIKRR